MSNIALADDSGNFSNTEFQLLMNYGPDKLYEDDPEEDELKKTFTATFDHFSTWRLGANYFFLDITGDKDYDFFNEGNSFYFEYTPSLSINKMFDINFGNDSILREISIAGQIDTGRTAGFEINRVFLEGGIISWNIPLFAVFDTAFYARHEKDYKTGWQTTIVWLSPFSIGPSKWVFRGFADIWQRKKDKGFSEDATVFIAQPQLLLNLDMFNLKEFNIGVEVQVSNNFPSKALYADKNNAWDYVISPMIMFRF